MKIIQKTNRYIKASLPACLLSLAACGYLDVIPPAQPDFDDTMKDEAATLGFLYTSYSYLKDNHPFDYGKFENSADEMVHPKDWGSDVHKMLFGTISSTNDVGWVTDYNYIGYVHYFLEQIDKLQPVGVTEEDKQQYKAECYFLEAYYHFRVLEAFGPCPLIKEKVDQNISKEDIPGRSHFDYCVDYIVGKLDEAAAVLPQKREMADLGRADATICKCLKARVLLYAASPLWNGSFYDRKWSNQNYETPGYGKELVSSSYDAAKWERALTACKEALAAAEAAGYELFDIETANNKAERDKVPLPFVPGREEDTEENKEFKERVRMFQYLVTAHEGDNNKEIIWGVSTSGGIKDASKNISRLPNKIIKLSNGSWHSNSGFSGWAPTLNAVKRFYTENGDIPEHDKSFYPESEWYTRFYEGTSSPDLATNDLDKEDVKNDIIKFNAHREARYYAWIAFDGGEYSSVIKNGSPLWLNLKNSNTNGYSAGLRNAAGTGFLTKKFISPDIVYTPAGAVTGSESRTPFIRMAELYLNLAECYGALDKTTEALEQLNIIRKRAGLKELATADLSGMSLTDWIRNERFVELYQEGHRYYDVRRWGIAPDMLKAGVRYGLNGLTVNPSFEKFNTPTLIDQPIKWDNRQYLAPVVDSERYSNPQLVQAPGY